VSSDEGFYEQFQALKPEMVSFIDQKKEEKDQIDEILFVGHSLGGGVAALAGASLAPLYDKIKSRVVTIGAPLVGAESFQDLFKKRSLIVSNFYSFRFIYTVLIQSLRIKHHTRLRLLTDPIPLSPRFYWYRKH
jgi:alpha-beta hydrolase superfamily lysophospholipase